MNADDIKQVVKNRDDSKAVTMHCIAEREQARLKLASDVEAFLANGGKIQKAEIEPDRALTPYNTAIGVRAK